MEDFSEGNRSLWIDRPRGIRLHLRDYAGPDTQAPVLFCLAGLTRNSRDFHRLALKARSSARIVALDSRGRGLSTDDSDPSHYNVEVETGDVIAVMEALGLERAVFIGTSRGGLILHRLIALRPDLIAAVVLNDIGPVIPTSALVSLVNGLKARNSESTFEAAAAALRGAQAAAFPALNEDDWALMAQALYRPSGQGVEPAYDRALLQAFEGLTEAIVLPDLWQAFALFAPLPLMVIRGEHSDILPVEVFDEMQRRHPGLAALTAPGQGHAPLLDKEPVFSRLMAWLDASRARDVDR
ncbi:hypothetical protein BJF93_17300 [Xaviernesmea oryzae]|uniref:AB hydrolase-1 domain-containing protein n=1 Tax=Xaviernesmea oryzae TaxID=464029 RepID=A0A1Q9ATQ0_9HYPH|nr:hypothetical protein BJF93_17300 [Xaviernesmea oryzae]